MATASAKNGLCFNLLFGALIGIYTSNKNVFLFEGLFYDTNLWKYLLRLVYLMAYLLALVLVSLVDLGNIGASFVGVFLASFGVGLMFTTFFIWSMEVVKLYDVLLKNN